MTKSFLLSLLAHATVLAVGWCVTASVTAPRPHRALALQVHGEETEPVDRPPPDPPAPSPQAAPAEEFVAERPPEEESVVVPDVDVAAPPELVSCSRLATRLATPLRRKAKPSAPVAPAPVALSPPPPTRAPRPAAGPTRGARVSRNGALPIVYPAKARRLGLEGRITLRILVSANGRVAEVEVAESSGHEILDRAAIDAVWTWRFDPALKNGRPVQQWYERTIRFHLVS